MTIYTNNFVKARDYVYSYLEVFFIYEGFFPISFTQRCVHYEAKTRGKVMRAKVI